jgi:hypothetical protein
MAVGDAAIQITVSMYLHQDGMTEDLTQFCAPATSFSVYYTQDGGSQTDITSASFVTVVDSSDYATNVY